MAEDRRTFHFVIHDESPYLWAECVEWLDYNAAGVNREDLIARCKASIAEEFGAGPHTLIFAESWVE